MELSKDWTENEVEASRELNRAMHCWTTDTKRVIWGEEPVFLVFMLPDRSNMKAYFLALATTLKAPVTAAVVVVVVRLR
jgi:hypothetical protein